MRSRIPVNPAAATAIVLVVLATTLAPAEAQAAVETYRIDREHTAVGFSVRHFFSKVPGRFTEFDGALNIDREDLTNSSVEITIQAASIDTDEPARDNHLRSDAFFDVENHPRITFVSKKIRDKGNGQLLVVGDLTIRGTTKKVVLNVEVLGFGKVYNVERAAFEARTQIDRTDYGVSWNDVVEGGGAILGDEVDIVINLQAKKVAGE